MQHHEAGAHELDRAGHAAETPVFVDLSGNRKRLLVGMTSAFVFCCTVSVAFVVYSASAAPAVFDRVRIGAPIEIERTTTIPPVPSTSPPTTAPKVAVATTVRRPAITTTTTLPVTTTTVVETTSTTEAPVTTLTTDVPPTTVTTLAP